MGEVIQGVTDTYSNYSQIVYIVHSCYALCILPWLFMNKGRVREALRENKDMVKLTIYTSLLLFGIAWLWYVSLNQTLVAANNAIYQSQCVFCVLPFHNLPR